MTRYICSTLDIALDRRYYFYWDTDTGPLSTGRTLAAFKEWMAENFPYELTEKRLQAAEKFGCSGPAYLFEELVALAGYDYEQFIKEWT